MIFLKRFCYNEIVKKGGKNKFLMTEKMRIKGKEWNKSLFGRKIASSPTTICCCDILSSSFMTLRSFLQFLNSTT